MLSRPSRRPAVILPPADRPNRGWREAALATLPAWVAARVAVAFGYVLARVAVDQLAVARPAPLLDGLMAWDAHHYRVIAEHGYEALPQGFRFFPVFPMVVRAVSVLTFGNTTAAALLIGNLAALLLGMAVYRLVLHETADAAIGRLAVWFLLASAGAAPLVMGYGEALGALTSVLAFLAARKRRWGWAAAGALIVGGTWSVGWLLAVPLAFEAARGIRQAGIVERLARVASVAAPVAATAAYIAWVDVTAGDGWRRVVTVQTDVYDRTFLDPVTAMYRSAEDLVAGHHASGLTFLWALLAIAVAVAAFRRLPASYGAYLAVVVFVAISAENTDSFERYLLRAFPVAIAAALVLRREWQQRLAVSLGLGGLVVYACAIFLGAKVP